MMKHIADLLAEHPFFADLEAAHRDVIAGCGRNVTFKPGEPLTREGAAANEFFAIRRGKVSIGIHVPQIGDTVIETLGDSDIVGWSWLFPPYRTHFDAYAIVATQAVAFDGACLRTKFENDPVLGYQLFKRFAAVMMDRMQAARLQLLDMYGNRG
ncbi:MAG: cyclic nucleotide-binding domain-containing protein [bacterium]